MVNKNPFDPLLDQIVTMLDKIKKGNLSKISDEDLAYISRHLDIVEKNVEIFNKIADQADKNKGDKGKKTKFVKVKESATSREKRFFKRARRIRNDIVDVKKEYETLKRREKLKKKRSRGIGRKRKKKFKRLGGEGWLPL